MSKKNGNGRAEEAGAKPVAPIPLEAVVRAYLEKKLIDLNAAVEQAREERKDAEVGMIAQLNRAVGQRDGQIAALEKQIKEIEAELLPPTEPGQNDPEAGTQLAEASAG